jgi:hypothetical protein
MSRLTDFKGYQALGGGNMPLQDMTPTPLTVANLVEGEGAGSWVRNPGRAGGVHVELSDTTAPSATVVIEYTNTRTAKGSFITDTLTLTVAGEGQGVPCFNGFQWVRVRVTAISGDSASVTATLGMGV